MNNILAYDEEFILYYVSFPYYSYLPVSRVAVCFRLPSPVPDIKASVG